MISLKPYLIRSIYEWILDNELTPHLLVDAEANDAILPVEFVEDGKIVLNVRPEAIQGLNMSNEFIEFNARFSGKPLHIVVPIESVMAIYAKENGKGMVFDQEEIIQDDEPPPQKPKPRAKPKLRVVK
ncbi:MAG: ClpXP protease specificity-enhancing factor [Gammaproteobacteria bacterium HGW-Gammaproteobacteria-3]|jgi:stringent starvation protein B|nr:MAG: ClpXP protease specificity-enhancing factor [Gammaproteobacteria bacterium HGW-Gammaproteobacteria-3]